MSANKNVRLSQYSALAAGLVGPLTGQAAIVYTASGETFSLASSNPYNQWYDDNHDEFNVAIDFDGLGGAEFYLSPGLAFARGWPYYNWREARNYASISFGTNADGKGVLKQGVSPEDCSANWWQPAALSAGDSIGSGNAAYFNNCPQLNAVGVRNLSTGGYQYYSPRGPIPDDGIEKFLGVTFQLDATGSQQYFGWIGIEFTTTIVTDGQKSWLRGDGVVTGFAYEDTGAAIAAGDMGPTVVPIPPALPLLASGFAGLALFRKYKNSRKS